MKCDWYDTASSYWYAMTMLPRPLQHVTNQKCRYELCWKKRAGAFLDQAKYNIKYNIALGCAQCFTATYGCLTEHGWFEVTSVTAWLF